MSRDERFVAVHRAGTLDEARHRQLAGWAAECAEPVWHSSRRGVRTMAAHGLRSRE